MAARGFAWASGQAVFNRLLSLVGFVVLARLLTPQDYGVVALATVFIALVSIFAAGGFSAALVQRPEVEREDLDSVFWLGLGTSLLLALAMSLAAWPLAEAFDEPQLRPVLQVLSVTFVFVGLGSTHQAVLQRRLDFRSLALRTMVANAVATVVGLAAAFGGLGVWSLLVQTVLGSALSTIGMMVRSGYRPAWRISPARFRSLFGASKHYAGTSLMNFTNQRTDNLLIGAVLGTGPLGIYVVGYRMLTVMLEILTTTVRTVAFPIFARLQDDPDRLLRAYTSAIRMCATLAIPCFMFVMATAPDFIRVLFGEKWDASAPVLRILCLFGALQSIMTFNVALLQAVGRQRLVFRLSVFATIVQVAVFAVAVGYGIEWVAIAFVARNYALAPMALIPAARELRTGVWAALSAAGPPVASALVMATGVLLAGGLLDPATPAWVRLIVLAATGAVVYLLALRATGRKAFEEVLGYGRKVLQRQPVDLGATMSQA